MDCLLSEQMRDCSCRRDQCFGCWGKVAKMMFAELLGASAVKIKVSLNSCGSGI